MTSLSNIMEMFYVSCLFIIGCIYYKMFLTGKVMPMTYEIEETTSWKSKKLNILFLVAGIYNFSLAFIFFFGRPLSVEFSLTHFAVILLLVFGVMFCQIAINPYRYKSLIPYAILRNFSYCAVAAFFWQKEKLSPFWLIPGVIDSFFLLFFIGALVYITWFHNE